MSAEDELKDGYRRIIDAISRGDADGLNELVAPYVVDHKPIPNQAPRREGFKQ
jgi:DNA-binding FadR family transcriptional regulator